MHRILSFFAALVIATSASAQWAQPTDNEVAPNRVMVRLTPQAATALTEAFAEARTPKTSITQVQVTNSALINRVLGVPSLIGVTGIKPFIAQNSIVFPDIRRKMNPTLFTNSFAPVPPKQDQELRKAEDKVSRWFELRYAADLTPEQVASMLQKSRAIEYAEPRYIRRTQFIPNDSLVKQQYHLESMNIFEAWDHVRCDSNIIVANVDVGVDWSHPDIYPAVKINWGEMGKDDEGNEKWSNAVDDDNNGMIDDWHGWDFAGNFGETSDNDTRTEDDHGTHTTGITAAVTNNKIGIAGIAFGASVLPIKAADNFGTYISFGYEGIAYAANMGVRIVNCSWGGRQRSQAEDEVIQYAYAKNTLVIAASGNNGSYQDFYPASYDHVLSVGSLSTNGAKDYFTNYGIKLDVGAPGQSILSTVPNAGYSYQNGTSMATPQVSGAAALVLAQNPTLNAGQLAEVIRASAKGNVDTTAKDLLGRGMIDIGRAVTDTNLYSTRIEQVEVFDNNNDGILAAGELGGIEISVKNWLKPLKALKGKIEFVQNGEHLITNVSELTFGESNTLSVVKNLRADFRFQVAELAPPNTTVLVKVTLFDASVGYGPDVDFFRLTINPNYRDLNKNNLVVTFDSKGGIGYNDPVEHTQGSGFLWQNAPEEIPSSARSLIYQGGLMASVDDWQVVSIAPAVFPGFADQDFAPRKAITEVNPPDHPKAVQELYTVFADTEAPDSVQVGVTIDQKSYAFNEGMSSNAVVIDYLLIKRAAILPHSDSTNFALYMDWDIGPSGALNQTYWIDSNKTAVMRRMDPNFPWIAMRVISDVPQGAEINFHAISNDGSEGIVETYGGFDPMEKWMAMTIQRDFAGPGDVSHVFGIKNVPFASSEFTKLTYVIGVGVDEASAVAAVNDAEKVWEGPSSVSRGPAYSSSIEVFPNPFSDRISASLPKQGASRVRIIDAMGRVVFENTFSGGDFEITGLELPQGFYMLDVEQNGERYRTQLVRMK